jgi:hypothetical protein
MGGYYGSPKITLKNNKNLLGEKNKLTRKDYIGYKRENWEDHIKASPELLAEIRKRKQTENKKTKKQQMIFVLLIIIIIYLAFYFLN